MKGTLVKTDQGWMVEYWVDERTSIGHKSWWEKLPLHPDFIEMMDTCFTSKFTHEIEFEIVRYCKKHNSDPSKNSVCTLDCGYEEVSYAKPITGLIDTSQTVNHIDKVETVNHVPDVGKMVEDDIKKIERLAELNGSPDSSGFYDYKEGFVDGYLEGYNKAKETLYTKDQAKEIWNSGQEYWKTSGASITFEELIEKLKQLKSE